MFAQVTKLGGGSYATVNAAFSAINAGTHTGECTLRSQTTQLNLLFRFR